MVYIVALFVLLLGIVVVKMMSRKEGFENGIGMYDYLAPPSDKKAFSWSDDTVKKFTEKYNKIPNIQLKLTSEMTKAVWCAWVSEQEALLYIQKGAFPLNLYIQNFINNKTNVLQYGKSKGNASKVNGIDVTNDNINILSSNRLIYYAYIRPVEEVLAPLSYQYFTGTLEPPASNALPGMPSPSMQGSKGFLPF